MRASFAFGSLLALLGLSLMPPAAPAARVPVRVNLGRGLAFAGPVGIVGGRSLALTAARHFCRPRMLVNTHLLPTRQLVGAITYSGVGFRREILGAPFTSYGSTQVLVQREVIQQPAAQERFIQREVVQQPAQERLIEREVVQQPVQQERLTAPAPERQVIREIVQQPAAQERIIEREVVQQPAAPERQVIREIVTAPAAAGAESVRSYAGNTYSGTGYTSSSLVAAGGGSCPPQVLSESAGVNGLSTYACSDPGILRQGFDVRSGYYREVILGVRGGYAATLPVRGGFGRGFRGGILGGGRVRLHGHF